MKNSNKNVYIRIVRIVQTLMILLCLSEHFYAQSTDQLSQDLLAHWTFDGHVQNATSDQFHGQNIGAQFGEDRFGRPNSALHCINGGHVLVDDASNLFHKAPYTLSMWIKSSSADNGVQMIMTKDRDLHPGALFISNRFLVVTEYVNYTVPQDRWVHMVISYDQLYNWTVYIDGQIYHSANVGLRYGSLSSQLVFGRHYTCPYGDCGWEYFYTGYLDDIRIYNRALSHDEVSMLFTKDVLDTKNIGDNSIVPSIIHANLTAIGLDIQTPLSIDDRDVDRVYINIYDTNDSLYRTVQLQQASMPSILGDQIQQTKRWIGQLRIAQPGTYRYSIVVQNRGDTKIQTTQSLGQSLASLDGSSVLLVREVPKLLQDSVHVSMFLPYYLDSLKKIHAYPLSHSIKEDAKRFSHVRLEQKSLSSDTVRSYMLFDTNNDGMFRAVIDPIQDRDIVDYQFYASILDNQQWHNVYPIQGNSNRVRRNTPAISVGHIRLAQSAKSDILAHDAVFGLQLRESNYDHTMAIRHGLQAFAVVQLPDQESIDIGLEWDDLIHSDGDSIGLAVNHPGAYRTMSFEQAGEYRYHYELRNQYGQCIQRIPSNNRSWSIRYDHIIVFNETLQWQGKNQGRKPSLTDKGSINATMSTSSDTEILIAQGYKAGLLVIDPLGKEVLYPMQFVPNIRNTGQDRFVFALKPNTAGLYGIKFVVQSPDGLFVYMSQSREVIDVQGVSSHIGKGDVYIDTIVYNPSMLIEGSPVTFSTSVINQGNAPSVVDISYKVSQSQTTMQYMKMQSVVVWPGEKLVIPSFRRQISTTFGVHDLMVECIVDKTDTIQHHDILVIDPIDIVLVSNANTRTSFDIDTQSAQILRTKLLNGSSIKQANLIYKIVDNTSGSTQHIDAVYENGEYIAQQEIDLKGMSFAISAVLSATWDQGISHTVEKPLTSPQQALACIDKTIVPKQIYPSLTSLYFAVEVPLSFASMRVDAVSVVFYDKGISSDSYKPIARESMQRKTLGTASQEWELYRTMKLPGSKYYGFVLQTMIQGKLVDIATHFVSDTQHFTVQNPPMYGTSTIPMQFAFPMSQQSAKVYISNDTRLQKSSLQDRTFTKVVARINPSIDGKEWFALRYRSDIGNGYWDLPSAFMDAPGNYKYTISLQNCLSGQCKTILQYGSDGIVFDILDPLEEKQAQSLHTQPAIGYSNLQFILSETIPQTITSMHTNKMRARLIIRSPDDRVYTFPMDMSSSQKDFVHNRVLSQLGRYTYRYEIFSDKGKVTKYPRNGSSYSIDVVALAVREFEAMYNSNEARVSIDDISFRLDVDHAQAHSLVYNLVIYAANGLIVKQPMLYANQSATLIRKFSSAGWHAYSYEVRDRQNNLVYQSAKPRDIFVGFDNQCDIVQRPAIISRSAWCIDNRCETLPLPGTTRPTHVAVHHSVTPNESFESLRLPSGEIDWNARVRQIWSTHAITKGWGDIGYNYLITPDGKIYQGRKLTFVHGKQIDEAAGYHFSCMNQEILGIVMVGNFHRDVYDQFGRLVLDAQKPSEKAMKSLDILLEWVAKTYKIDPKSSSIHTMSNLKLPHIVGHRDGNGAQVSGKCTVTSCPGDLLYPLLQNVRNDVTYDNCVQYEASMRMHNVDTTTQVSQNPYDDMQQKEREVLVYPNPFDASFTLKLSNKVTDEFDATMQYVIYDMQARVVSQGTTSSDGVTNINVDGKSGIYILKVYDANTIYTHTLKKRGYKALLLY